MQTISNYLIEFSFLVIVFLLKINSYLILIFKDLECEWKFNNLTRPPTIDFTLPFKCRVIPYINTIYMNDASEEIQRALGDGYTNLIIFGTDFVKNFDKYESASISVFYNDKLSCEIFVII